MNTDLPSAKPRPSILIVEDEPGTRQGLELLLGLEGYVVVTAANGRQGLDALASRPFSLVITDQMMPLMDGVEFVRAVRRDERFRALPLVMMSASARPPGTVVELMDAFIPKPFEIPVLLRLIEQLLDETPQRRENGAGQPAP